LVPVLVRRFGERAVMVAGALGFAACGPVILLPLSYSGILALWSGFGLTSSLVLTPGGLVITRSAQREDRPAVFAAQFSLSHAGWLLAYPLAGWLGTAVGLTPALLVLSGLAIAVAVVATRVWPDQDPVQRTHSHPELPEDHPHLQDVPASGPGHQHRHDFRIDDLHPDWSRSTG